MQIQTSNYDFFRTIFVTYDLNDSETYDILRQKERSYSDISHSGNLLKVYCNIKKILIEVDTSRIIPYKVCKVDTLPPHDCIFTEYQGYPLIIKNQSWFTKFSVCTSPDYGIILEAKDSNGQWRPIEYIPKIKFIYFLNVFTLYPNECLILSIPKYTGDFETSLRVKVTTSCFVGYSQEYPGRINLSQFEKPQPRKDNPFPLIKPTD